MKTIGIIGGMSAESTAIYYNLLNKGVRERRGGLHSADLIVRSLDFAPIARLQADGDWEEAGNRLAAAARQLDAAGADVILLATNTMHIVIDAIERAVNLPVLHIVDATGAAIRRAGLSRPGLMATRFTMEQEFYVGRLTDRFDLQPIIPAEPDRTRVHDIIYDELCRGIITEAARAQYVAVADRLVQRGADGLILGCTEVGLLLNQSNVGVPVFNTVELHVEAALDVSGI